MAKLDSKAVSFRFRSEVVWALEDLVSAWGSSQTGAVERAIAEAHLRVKAGGDLEEAGAESRRQSRQRVQNTAVQGVSEPSTAFNPGAIPGVQVGTGILPKNAQCLHCGKGFAGLKRATLCPECQQNGHQGDRVGCMTCNEGAAI